MHKLNIMTKNYFINFILIAMAILINSCQSSDPQIKSQYFTPTNSFEEASAWADSMVTLMTLEEKVGMIGGREIFYTEEIPRLNIPKVLFVDATQGIHLRSYGLLGASFASASPLFEVTS